MINSIKAKFSNSFDFVDLQLIGDSCQKPLTYVVIDDLGVVKKDFCKDWKWECNSDTYEGRTIFLYFWKIRGQLMFLKVLMLNGRKIGYIGFEMPQI
ncbi:uncharacterized protein LOC108979282 isoform X3 [Juglans regia]|uniref:Uncharacterized protein LOC108979282 isoform X3 n=1 Tax=Juglans regia TaxID=51240 RepID=A0A6P9E8C5_JUGRE|nr:uncharacterized protein LOC108979282 isoform X3 [Juglans regia]